MKNPGMFSSKTLIIFHKKDMNTVDYMGVSKLSGFCVHV